VRWIVGDIQGCARELERLLREIRFDPGRDELWSAGDLVNRGPDSLAVLRLWRSVGGTGVVGNHEVAALLAHSGARPRKMAQLRELFRASDAEELLQAVRELPVLVHLPARYAGPDAWLVHGGLHPHWHDLPSVAAGLNDPEHDDEWLQGAEVDFATNVRCCTKKGKRSDFSGPTDTGPRGDTTGGSGRWGSIRDASTAAR